MTCASCGGPFEPKLRGSGSRKPALYCSPACRRRASRSQLPAGMHLDCVRTQSERTSAPPSTPDPSAPAFVPPLTTNLESEAPAPVDPETLAAEALHWRYAGGERTLCLGGMVLGPHTAHLAATARRALAAVIAHALATSAAQSPAAPPSTGTSAATPPEAGA